MMLPCITLAASMAAFAPHAAPAARTVPLMRNVPFVQQQGTDAVVQALSVVPDQGRADVLVDVDPSVDLQDFTLDSPHRIVVDIKGSTLIKPNPTYDRVMRGGIVNVRVAQYRADIVRVVLEVDQAYSYDIKRDAHDLRIVVHGSNAKFTAWHSASAAADANDEVADQTSTEATSTASAPSDATRTSYAEHRQREAAARTVSAPPAGLTPLNQQSTQPRITVTYQDADIHDVIAAFATFAGRTIVVGKDVTGTVSAEIRNQPWDVALRAILQGQGLAASEDPSSGIITVDSYANIEAKQALEPLVTKLIPINYAKADSLVPVVTKLLYKDCSNVPGGSEGQPTAGGLTCVTRGAVAANPGTNTLIVTETPSRIGDIIRYVKKLDVRTPQVAIKAKIIFVDRTDIENLGLSYDLGSRNQFFSQLVQRVDPSTLKPVDTNGDGVPDALGGGQPYTGDKISLGGNTLSAIANANARVTSPALSLVYSAALGKFSLTSFLDALQETRLADLQAEPSIVTVDNREAQIQVGQDIPVRVLDANTSNVGGQNTGNAVPRATVSFKPVGIILKVTPHITNNHQILLDVHAENSDAQIASSDVGYVFNKQSADNRLLVRDGETAVIGGLTVTQVSQSKTGIPLLVDLPVIGKLFGTTNKSEEKRDLLILITPHVVDDDDSANPSAGQ